MTPSKWDGLLDEAGTHKPYQCAPAPRRGPTIIALTLLAVIAAGAAVLVWRQWTTAPTPELAASPSSTPAMDPTTPPMPAPASSAPSTPETPSASPEIGRAHV